MGFIDKMCMMVHAFWINRTMRQFGPVGSLGLQIHISQELVKKAAKDLGRHPEILAQQAIDKAEIKLFAVNRGVTP